jgi:hypothetical protein
LVMKKITDLVGIIKQCNEVAPASESVKVSKESWSLHCGQMNVL